MIKPLGARVIVEEIQAVDGLTERAKASGLTLVVREENVPKPTTGKVVAVGSDPLTQDQVKEGDIIFFSKHAGSHLLVEGKQYRVIELHEIISVQSPEA